MNHALVQIYENKKKTGDSPKEVKAKIKAHSDKTKDMPKEALIAFCTFYDDSNADLLKPSDTDRFDVCYKQTSALTRLHFKLKKTVEDDALEKEFSVTLYPDSAFLIPLSTNRLYTHEIRPSVLGVDQIPVRMGYVVRCSNLEAMHTEGQTYIKENGQYIQLEEMTPELREQLRNSYYEENSTEHMIEYGKVHFSMNSGDYEKPIFNHLKNMSHTAFHKIVLPLERNLFDELFHSTEFESTGKGRLGNHLVRWDGQHIPVVRTTTRYTIPATAFSEIHQSLIELINETLSVEKKDISFQNFNNALIEVYDAVYSKMGFHSDQALDLEDHSFIALFSCYEKPDELKDFQLRKLVIKNKTTDEESEIILHHNSVVLFSLETNKNFSTK